MKKINYLTMLCLIASGGWVLSMSANAVDMVAKAYEIQGVTEVEVGGSSELEITQGDTDSLRVEAAATVIDHVKADLTGQKLTLEVKQPSSGWFGLFNWGNAKGEKARFILQVKNLRSVKSNGASHVALGNFATKQLVFYVNGASELNSSVLTVDDLFMNVSGASHVNTHQLTVSTLKLDLSGASNVDIKAVSSVSRVRVDTSGASNLHGKLLTAQEADVSASGASTIELNVTNSLKADASGASTIQYWGEPKVNKSVSGASHVNALKL